MVEFKNVSYTYPNGQKALHDINLEIGDGEFVFVIGANGAGKSTAIKLMLRELTATEGSVIINGYNLSKLKTRKVPEFRRTIGVVFQDYRLIPDLTVYDNVAFALRVTDAPKKYIRSRVPYVLSLVGLAAKAKSHPEDLSGGEQQRVALARALVNDPKIIIADEPTGNIDPQRSYEIINLLREIHKCGTTVLIVTHQHDLVKYFGGRVISINAGAIAFNDYIGGADDITGEADDAAASADDIINEVNSSIGNANGVLDEADDDMGGFNETDEF